MKKRQRPAENQSIRRSSKRGPQQDGELEGLLELLEKVWLRKRREIEAKWRRTLPFGDYIVDRWKKAMELGFGEGASIYDSALVFGDVQIGDRTWIGPFVILDGSGGLSIGANCSISAGVQIYSHDSVKWALSGGKDAYEYARTTIGNNCYIGPNAIITKGVHIGDGSVVGANSLVLNTVPPGSRIFGNPARSGVSKNANRPAQ